MGSHVTGRRWDATRAWWRHRGELLALHRDVAVRAPRAVATVGAATWLLIGWGTMRVSPEVRVVVDDVGVATARRAGPRGAAVAGGAGVLATVVVGLVVGGQSSTVGLVVLVALMVPMACALWAAPPSASPRELRQVWSRVPGAWVDVLVLVPGPLRGQGRADPAASHGRRLARTLLASIPDEDQIVLGCRSPRHRRLYRQWLPGLEPVGELRLVRDAPGARRGRTGGRTG